MQGDEQQQQQQTPAAEPVIRQVSLTVPAGERGAAPAQTHFSLSLSAEAGEALARLTAGYAVGRQGIDGGQAIDLMLRDLGAAIGA